MTSLPNPYDELPYKSLPIEWTAPERLALTALLHGGPRQSLGAYRVLELGCADGANLLPMAYYRRSAQFVGLDGAASQISLANSRRTALQLSNIEFIHADLLRASELLTGEFDFIIGHGIFSWVSHEVRDSLLQLCAQRLCRGGLFYLNYNTRPGWNIRGMVREFLLAQTSGVTPLGIRAEQAQTVAARVVASLADREHPYSKLMANEFRFVCESDLSYVAHEFLARENHPYWRSEFLDLVQRYGFDYVADADYNYSSGRIPEDLAARLAKEDIIGRTVDDSVDLFCYRQLHSPILTTRPFQRSDPDSIEFGNLLVASCLQPASPTVGGNPMFQHPSGYQVEAKEKMIVSALERLSSLWPRALRINLLFPDVRAVMDDLKLLQRNGLIELRCADPDDCRIDRAPLNALEGRWNSYATTPYHTREPSSEAIEVNHPDTDVSSEVCRSIEMNGHLVQLETP